MIIGARTSIKSADGERTVDPAHHPFGLFLSSVFSTASVLYIRRPNKLYATATGKSIVLNGPVGSLAVS